MVPMLYFRSSLFSDVYKRQHNKYLCFLIEYGYYSVFSGFRKGWRRCEKIFLKNLKFVVDNWYTLMYNSYCVTEKTTRKRITGCGSAWLERLVWDQEVAGSNPVTPTSRV